MGRIFRTFIFSFFASLIAVAIDAFYHLATETTVHINYVAVKFVIIFAAVFLVAYWSGKRIVDIIFASISGPVIFYVYYIFAYPTLDRSIFKIDENFGYIFVHIFAMLISYFIVFKILNKKYLGKNSIKIQKTKFALLFVIFGIIGSIYTFIPYKTINDVFSIGLGLRHNTHVLIGAIALIVAIASLYKVIRMKN